MHFRKNGNLTIAGTLTESSDERFKTDVEPLGSVLTDLETLRPVRFRFKEGTGHPAETQLGLLAQEVQAVFPELVTEDGDGYLSLAYPKLTAVLLKGLQEQQAQIETLEQRMATLEPDSPIGARMSLLGGAVPRGIVSGSIAGLLLFVGAGWWARTHHRRRRSYH